MHNPIIKKNKEFNMKSDQRVQYMRLEVIGGEKDYGPLVHFAM
jgi:hypothetical protein